MQSREERSLIETNTSCVASVVVRHGVRRLTDKSTIGMGILPDLWRAYLERRYTVLFYIRLFTLVTSPLMAAFGISGTLVESLLAACLLAAVMPVNAGKYRSLLLEF
jgi:hypothetical protein